MRVLESSEADVSPGRPVSLGKCCIYTHPNYCLRPPCSSVLPSGLMNKALRVEAPECEVVAPSLSLLASTICIWASVPWSANAGHWVILREVLTRVLGAVRLLQVFAHHHHQDLRHLVLRAGIEILRAARSTTDPAQFHPLIHPGIIYQIPPMGIELCLVLCGATRQTGRSLIWRQLFPISSCLIPWHSHTLQWALEQAQRCWAHSEKRGLRARRLGTSPCSALTYQVTSAKSFSFLGLSFFIRKFS